MWHTERVRGDAHRYSEGNPEGKSSFDRTRHRKDNIK
jgi:hypothetical protein